MFLRVLLATLFLLFTAAAFADVGIGDKREDVLRLYGIPTSRAQRGDREILLYPHGGRIELIDGKVTEVKGPLPAPLAPTDPGVAAGPAAAPATTSTAPASADAPPKPPAPKPLVPYTTGRGKPSAVATDAGNPAAAADALGHEVEKMDTAWGERPQVPVAPRFSVPKLLVSIVLHFALTLFALRIAFKIEEMDAVWSGTLAIAGIDVAVYATLELLGPVTSGLSSMAGIESGIGALVMVATIQKFCFNKRLQNAVITAMAVKLIVQLCHIFVFVLLLNALFG